MFYDEFDDEADVYKGPVFDPYSYLKGLHTRQLMNLRLKLYRVTGIGGDCTVFSGDSAMRYDVTGNGSFVTMAQVKAELATRPHVLNKQEAKALRRAKAQGRA